MTGTGRPTADEESIAGVPIYKGLDSSKIFGKGECFGLSLCCSSFDNLVSGRQGALAK